MNYHKIEKTSIANGPGVRIVLWVSGCRCHCHGCHNPETWDLNSGKLFDKAAKQELLDAISKSWIQGITFSGGHPLEPENLPEVYNLIKDIRKKYPEKDIWLYTGYTLSVNDFDASVDGVLKNYILTMCDVVVDGPFIEDKKDITLAFRGSKNQRLIDVKKTIEQQQIILYNTKLLVDV